MGEETRQFATRFSTAVALLAALAPEDDFRTLRRRHGAGLASAVREALDAVEAVYATGTSAVRDWPERSARVLERVGALRRALARDGVDADVRLLAGALVEVLEAPSGSAG